MKVVIDGVSFVPEQRFYSKPQPPAIEISVAVDIHSEKNLLESAAEIMSESSWLIGRCAAEWIKRYSRGRTDADFGSLIGLTTDQVYQRRRVWETFMDVRANYPNIHWAHFYSALEWDDATECLKWANEVKARVNEMRAWRRAQHGEDLAGDE